MSALTVSWVLLLLVQVTTIYCQGQNMNICMNKSIMSRTAYMYAFVMLKFEFASLLFHSVIQYVYM